jgi:hypothetical protein
MVTSTRKPPLVEPVETPACPQAAVRPLPRSEPGRRPPQISIRDAFNFEKQVQGWSRAKREALIDGWFADLPELASSKAPVVRGVT